MASIPFNKTKIVATIGPASNTYEVLRDLIRAGVDVCRLNLSHGDYSVHQQVIETIRRINEELRVHTAILIDPARPETSYRPGGNEPAMLVRGEELVFTSQECTGNAQQVYMNYRQFPQDVAIGDTVLIDDGKLSSVSPAPTAPTVSRRSWRSAAPLRSRKGVNLPNTKISLPSLTAKDLDDLQFALRMNVDWIGLSFSTHRATSSN